MNKTKKLFLCGVCHKAFEIDVDKNNQAQLFNIKNSVRENNMRCKSCIRKQHREWSKENYPSDYDEIGNHKPYQPFLI